MDRLSRREILSFAGGEVASNLAWTMVLIATEK